MVFGGGLEFSPLSMEEAWEKLRPIFSLGSLEEEEEAGLGAVSGTVQLVVSGRTEADLAGVSLLLAAAVDAALGGSLLQVLRVESPVVVSRSSSCS